MLSFLRLCIMYSRWSLRWPCGPDGPKYPPCSSAFTSSRASGPPCASDLPSPANTHPGLPSHRATWLHSGPTMGGCLSKPKPGDEHNPHSDSVPRWLNSVIIETCLHLYIGRLTWPLTAVVMWLSFSAGGILMLLIAVFKGIRQWNMSCVSNVSQCIAGFLLWWLGEGALPRGSEKPFICPTIQLWKCDCGCWIS